MLKELVKQRRKMKGLTQQQLATASLLSRMTIYNVERNGSASLDTLRKLGKSLNIPELANI